MSIPAFYLDPEQWEKALALTGQEAVHAHVLRLKPGDELELFNGQGQKALCRIGKMTRKRVDLELESREFIEAPLARVVIALALSKATRRVFFMEKACELGASGIWLWQAERSQGKLSGALAVACKAQLVAGLKQSRNPWLPDVRLLANASDLASASHDAELKILPWEEAGLSPILTPQQLGINGLTIFAIGPEGGFAKSEVEELTGAGFAIASLGERVLRCETAASLCLGLHWWASQLRKSAGSLCPDSREKSGA